MQSWAVDLAKELKKRNNKEKIGAVVGNVLSVDPLRIGIENNQIILDDSNFWICNSLIENYNREATITENNNSLNVTITYKNILKENDKVLVISSEDNQNFFIVDKLL